jgi:hypothetical protein
MLIVIRRLGRAIAAWGLAALVAGSSAAPARAATLNWINAAGGVAGTAANWNPAQVPTELDLLKFELPGAYTVTFGNVVDSVLSQSIWGGDVTLVFNVTHGVKDGFRVAADAGQIATARLTSGTLRMGKTGIIGAGPGSIGTLRVAGGTSNLLQNGGATAFLYVGESGTGETVVINGGSAEFAGSVDVGIASGGVGTVRVRGLGDTGSGLRRSRLILQSPGHDLQLGTFGGHGIVEVLEGGLVRVERDLLLSEESGDESEITIGGENVIDSSEVRVKDDLLLCVNPSALAGQAGGTGTIVLDSLGVLVVDDSTVVGDPDGSSGSITIRPNSRMITKHLILQQSTGGTIDFQGGMLQIDGGQLVTSTNRLTIPGGSQSVYLRPSLQMLNDASASFSGTALNPPLVVGETFSAEMRVAAGAVLTATGARSILGKDGFGALYVEDGGIASLAGLDIGTGVTGEGSLIAKGPGSVVTLTGPLNVGGTTLNAGKAGSVFVSDGAALNLPGPVAGTVWPPASGAGDFEVFDGGEVNLAGVLTVRGTLNMVGGDVMGGSVSLRGEGAITGEGTVQSAILGGTDTTVSITAIAASLANLEIGSDAPGGNVLMRGVLDVGSSAITVHDPDSAVVGVVDIAGGELHLPAGGGVIESGKRLVGDGTIHGPLVNRGYVIPVGPGWLQFAGTLYGTGQGVGGANLRLLPGGGFEGAGLLNVAKFEADSGSTIRATGNLEIGNTIYSTPLVLLGRVETGGNAVLFRRNGVDFGGELVLGGGDVQTSFASPLTLLSGARIEGRGDVHSPLTVAGTIAPGSSAGRLRAHVGATFAGGSLEIELGNHEAGEWDTLEVDGALTLDGNLELRRLPTFAAATGDSYAIVLGDSTSGAFDSVTLDGAPLAGELEVHYGPTGVWVVILQATTGVGNDPANSPHAGRVELAPSNSPGSRPGVALALPLPASVSLAAYDVSGRQVARLHQGDLAAGRHRFDLPSSCGSAGVYFIRASVDDGSRRVQRITRVIRLR